MIKRFFNKFIAVFTVVSLLAAIIDFSSESNTAKAAGQKVALLFAMQDYPGEVNDLAGPVNDMIGMEAVLEHAGYTVYRYNNESKANLLSTVSSRASSLTGEDTLLFAYSGHGADGGYIVAADDGFISITELESSLSQHSGVKEVILDACFSGDFIGKDYQSTEGFVKLETYQSFNDLVVSVFSNSATEKSSKELVGNNYYVMTACSGSQYSFEYGFPLSGSPFAVSNLTEYPGEPGYYALGYFNYAFHYGFGLYDNPAFTTLHADSNSDDRLSWNELYTYAAANTNDQQQAQVYPTNSNHMVLGVAVTGVVLDQSAITIDIDEQFTLHATVYPADAPNKNITWYSINENVATVENGVVTGKMRGETTIAVTTEDGGYTDTCTVTVERDYDFDPATGTLLKYYGDDANVIIPSTIGGVPVRIIGEEAFENMDHIVESITVPEGVTTLARAAFGGMANSLHTVNLPDSLIIIGDSAFISSYSLTTVNIPGNVETIGDNAFASCTSLTSITLPDSVTTIGGMAFVGCDSLESINVSAGNPNYKSVDGVLFTKDGTQLISYPGNRAGASYSIPSGTVSTAMSAFEECNNFTSVTIPNGFTTLGVYTFQHCEQLSSVTFGDDLETIDFGAFRGCINLTAITIPTTVTSLGGSVFSSCESLSSIIIPSNISIIDEFAFRSCSNLSSVTISEGVEQIRKYAFNDCTALSSINIPDSVTLIDSSVFNSCENLSNITVGSGNTSFKSVDGALMSKDGSLFHTYPAGKADTSYNVPDGVTDIADCAFYQVSNLTQIILPDGAQSIGDAVFNSCTALSKIFIPTTVTSIVNDTFKYCSNVSICGEHGSYAETYASANSIPFLCSSARLSDLTVDGNTVNGFSEDNYTYNVSVYYEMSEVEIGATPSDANGQITAGTGTKSLSVGLNSYTITCAAEDGIHEKTYTLNITRNSVLTEFNTSVYTINRSLGCFSGVPDEVSPADFKANFSNSPGYIKLYDLEGAAISPDYVGTGMTAKLEIDGSVEDELDILVLGDINSDGIIDIIDYSYVKLHIFDVIDLSGILFLAGDVDYSGEIDILDYTYIKMDIFGIASIN